MTRQTFPAKLSFLHAMLDFISSFSLKNNAPDPLVDKIILAAEEALINIIQHGYSDDEGTIEITCQRCSARPGITIILDDQGVPFNPTNDPHYALPFPHTIPESRKTDTTGGYGINLYRRIMDTVEYERVSGKNRLTLIKYF